MNFKKSKMYSDSQENTWYLELKPLQPWNVAPGNEDRMKTSIVQNFSLANHHSEKIGNGIPPT